MATTALSDVDLLSAARNGDDAAYTELYERHRDAARRLASTFRRLGDPDDLVNGAFERVLAALRNGAGPTESFRAYLFVTLRRLALEQSRVSENTEPFDEVPEPVEAVAGVPELEGADRQMIARAFESLPDQWQTVLWHTAVEGKAPNEIAPAVGLSPNAAAALAYRARERLRQAYLQAHLQASPRRGCEPHRSRLGGYVRGGLSRRHDAATREHLEECAHCRGLVDELSDVNRMLVRAIAPVFVVAGGGIAAHIGRGTAAASASTVGPSGLLSGATSAGRRVGSAAGGVMAAAVAAVVLGLTLIPHDGGPAPDGPVDVEAGAPGGTATAAARSRASTTTTTGAPATPPTSDATGSTAPGSGAATGPAAGSAADGTTATSEAGLLGALDGAVDALDADAGAQVDVADGAVTAGADVSVGDGGVDAQVTAAVDLGLATQWVAGTLGGGTLRILVPNEGTVAASGVTVDVQLPPAAQLVSLVNGCVASGENATTGLLSLMRRLTCGLGRLAAGSSATVDIPLVVVGGGADVTVSVLESGRVVSTGVVRLG